MQGALPPHLVAAAQAHPAAAARGQSPHLVSGPSPHPAAAQAGAAAHRGRQGLPAQAPSLHLAAADDDAPLPLPPKNAGRRNFVEMLHDVVSDPRCAHIVSWLPHGRGFVVHDRNVFAKRVLPRRFDNAKYASFARRLKRWNFERVARGPENGAY